MLNKESFTKIMIGLCELYKQQISEFIFDSYYEIFKKYETSAFERAVNLCVKNHKYNSLPKPANILEFLDGTREDQAMLAWLKAKEAVKKAGYYESVEFDDPIISNCIIELGGWMGFCSSLVDELPFVEKRFLELYRVISLRGSKSVKLIGFTEQRNSELGYEAPKTIKIGFEKRGGVIETI